MNEAATGVTGTVVLLIRSLAIGGAERQVVQLAKGLHARNVDVRVLVFYPLGELRQELESFGVRVEDLGKRGRWAMAGFLFRLISRLRAMRPLVLYSFLPVGNIVASCAKPFLPGTRVVWGVRASGLQLENYDRFTRWVLRLEKELARFPAAIIANSLAGREVHVRSGFPVKGFHVIENGIDTERFSFNAEGRRRMRSEWGVGDDTFLIGVAARLDPMKGLKHFVDASAIAARKNSRLGFVCIGAGEPNYTEELMQHARAAGLERRMIWAGAQRDMASVYSALDLACSPSVYGEGFSNSVAEAMACGVPCLVTDVGDSARIVGDSGSLVIPAADRSAMASAFDLFAGLPAVELARIGAAGRKRIIDLFSAQRMVEKTLACLLGR